MSKNLKISGLLFLSGFCALIYQTVWLRELRLIMGASTPATGTVLAIFMGGLGIGGLVLGKRADRVQKPLAFYANLEAGIALFSAITPFILYLGRSAYLGLGGTLVLGMFWGTIVRIIISIVVLIIPTFLMGGTLPAAARAARSASDMSNRGLALLYGMNTLGAVTGVVLSTFHLLEVHGNRRTLWIACAINLIVFLAARALSRRIEGVAVSVSSSEEPGSIKEVVPEGPMQTPAWVVLLAATVSGFAFFLMELVWYRMLSPVLGGSTYTFGTILAVALLGIGGGGIIYSFKSNRLPTLSSFAWTCAFEAFFLLLPFALGDRIAELALLLRNFGFYGFWGYVTGWAFICMIVVFPVSVIAGYQFPLLISLLNPKDERFAWKIGLTYGCNTAGSIAGSLLGGFGLLPLLTAPGAWKLTGILLLAVSLFAMTISLKKRALSLSFVTALFFLVAALSVAFSFSEGPTAVWRHGGIGAGRGFILTGGSPLAEFRIWESQKKLGVVREWDGIESSVALTSPSDGLAFLVNGKSDGHSVNDAGTQVMAGLIAAILHDNPKTSFVIGLGTGSTAGWLAAVPTMERVDVAEIEPVIKYVAEACGPVNCDAMKNPKVRVIMGDGREIIMSSPRKYDIIFSEPSNPYRAGISSLFTRDFYMSVANRLNVGGIFVHWVQTYEIDASSIWSIYCTVSEVFPYVESWQTTSGDIALVASMQPIRYDVPKLRRKIEEKPYRDAIRSAWGEDTLEGFLARRIAGPHLAQKIHSLPDRVLNTDDHNYLEFGFARSVGRNRNFDAGQIYAEGRKFADFYGPFDGQDINWIEVERKRLKWISFAQRDEKVLQGGEEKIKNDLDEAFTKGRWPEARQILRSNGDQLPFNTNRALLPIVLIETDDAETQKAVSAHSSYRPQEVPALQALYYIRKEKWEQSLASVLEFIDGLHKNPWASNILVSRLFSQLPKVARNTEGGSSKLIDALLKGPFAVHSHDAQRYQAAFAIAKADSGADHCAAIKKEKFYYNAGDRAYLAYLFNCQKDNRAAQEKLAEEIQKIREGDSLSFVQIIEGLMKEAEKK